MIFEDREAAASSLAARLADYRVKNSLVLAIPRGAVPTVIVEDAKRWPADVIVMGTHGRSGFNHLIFGSVAEGVVRTATVPILLMRGE